MYMNHPNKYRNKTDRIYRTLLKSTNEDRTSYRIAKETGISTSWVYYVLEVLESKGFIIDTKVIKPKKLLRAWANRPDRRLYREYHIRDPKDVLLKSSYEYVLTTYYADNLIAQYLFPRYFDIYIHFDDAKNWHDYLMKHGLYGRGNFRVFVDDEYVFRNKKVINDYSVVSIQQLIVDLLREGAECTHAAELLMEQYYGENRII